MSQHAKTIIDLAMLILPALPGLFAAGKLIIQDLEKKAYKQALDVAIGEVNKLKGEQNKEALALQQVQTILPAKVAKYVPDLKVVVQEASRLDLLQRLAAKL